MEGVFFLRCCQFFAFFKQAIDGYFLDLHHGDVVSGCHYDLIAEPDAFICVYDATGSQFSLFFAHVWSAGTNAWTSTFVEIVIFFEISTRAHSLLFLQTAIAIISVAVAVAHLIGDVVVLHKDVSFCLFESGSHVVRVILGPIVHWGPRRQNRWEVDRHHCL